MNPNFREIPAWGYTNGMTRVEAVYDDGQTLQEAEAYFADQWPGAFAIDVIKVIIDGYHAFKATIYN